MTYIETYANKEIIRLRDLFYKKCGLLLHCNTIAEVVLVFKNIECRGETTPGYGLQALAIAHNGFTNYRKKPLAKIERRFLHLKQLVGQSLHPDFDHDEFNDVHTPIQLIGFIHAHMNKEIL